MKINDGSEEQIIYYLDKPRGRFKDGESNPTYDNISIEIPTRMMPETEKWRVSSDLNDLHFELKNNNGDVIEKFSILKVCKVNNEVKKSRVMDLIVITFNVSYRGVKNAHL